MKTAILHYSVSPVIGGVEAVIQAQSDQFVKAGFQVTLLAGRGEKSNLPSGVDFIRVPEIDSMHPEILSSRQELNRGIIPKSFEELRERIYSTLKPLISEFDNLIVHNIMTKHFNLPLTAALFKLIKNDFSGNTLIWCHDLSWSSPNSKNKVFESYPWDLLKTPIDGVKYIGISNQQKMAIMDTFNLRANQVEVIGNGVDPEMLYALSAEGSVLIDRLNLLRAELIILMPVRITKAKNIEYALHLLSVLIKKIPETRLVITGPPDPHDQENLEYYFPKFVHCYLPYEDKRNS